MTKICVFGAGAIGGFLAGSLNEAGADVSVVARGPHLKAIRSDGLSIIKDGKTSNYFLEATDNAADFGIQDYVILAVKAHGITNILDNLKPLIGANTTVVSAVNGLPWWYFYKANSGTVLDNLPIDAVDPKGRIWNEIGPQKALGCVVYPACEIATPGVINHLSGDRFTLGEPSKEPSERLKLFSSLLIAGGLKAPQKAKIRDEIWIKLWGNCSFNPVSALTGATLDEIGADPETRHLIEVIMKEVQQVGESLGARFSVSIDKRIQGAASIIGHKPSTRQDIEAGRPLEIDPLLSTVIEVAAKLGIDTPALCYVTALLKMQAEKLNLYQRS
mgnify:CR=1 FL=1